MTLTIKPPHILPLFHLAQLLGVADRDRDTDYAVVVVEIAERRIGFVVDGLVGQQDIVIKPLGEYLEYLQGLTGETLFSGVTILDNGDISLVLDVNSLWREALQYAPETDAGVAT